MVYFSSRLEKAIKRVWKRGNFCRVVGSRERYRSRERLKDEVIGSKALDIREEKRQQGGYEPTNYVYCWQVGVTRWAWERVGEYFRMMREYERCGERKGMRSI
ncbi:MAG: hypothetical protein D6732_29435 [Methanobacteriota archaeon]|nr:MAG: hypothetical protein D6732_29435 [Euryarchaeota archaeon]